MRIAAYQIYKRVVRERVLPRGMSLERISQYTLAKEHVVVTVDWTGLKLMPIPDGAKDPKIGYKDPEIGFGYTYRIRSRFISSRPMTEEEIVASENMMKPPEARVQHVEKTVPQDVR
jgi:hypothetical protein